MTPVEIPALVKQWLPCRYVGKCNSSNCPCRFRPIVAEGIRGLMEEVRAGSELTALVADAIVGSCDLINSDPVLSKHFPETCRKFGEVVEFARQHAAKPTGALGDLDKRWEEINRADRAAASSEIAALKLEVERLREAVMKAHDKFEYYGHLHAAKPDVAKAATNFALANDMRAALTQEQSDG